jgi:hypothetical protein
MRFLKASLRFVRGALALIASILVLSIIGVSALAYLTLTGLDLTALRLAADGLGRVLSGQRTASMALTITAVPERDSFVGAADMVLRALEEGRGRFFFLLNEGMHVNRVDARLAGQDLSPVAYRLGPLLVIDTGTPIAAEQTLDLRIEYEGEPTGGTLGSSILFEPGRIRLPPDSLWYPADAQSFFPAEVTVTVPRGMTVVHNGEVIGETQRGHLRATRWRSARPIAGMALVAGSYEETTLEADGIRYRLFASPDERLDLNKVIALMAEADAILRSKLGTNGFPQVTAFITHELRRAFNDGSGVLALSNRYFRHGDYGFGLMAHELAHNWWGATIAEKWLSPGTGGEWLVEGFAEFSSIVVSETKYGAAARTLRLTAALFDPAKQRVIREMSVFDNSVAEDISRDTIYRKGAYVAYMLRQVIGEPQYFDALSQFLERFRYQQVSDADMQKALEEITGRDLDAYFEDWVGSDKLADLAIDKTAEGDLEVTNLGAARIAGDILLWKFRAEGSAPEAVHMRVGDRVALDPGITHMILDPLLEWADVERENNRFPRRTDPVAAAVSRGERILATFGAQFAWVRATVRELSAAGAPPNVWDFNRGLAQPPRFGRNGELAVVAEADPAPLSSVAVLSQDGARRILGRGESPELMPDGSIVAAAEDQLVQWSVAGVQRSLVRRQGFELDRPLASHDGLRIAYVSRRRNELEIRSREMESGADRAILSWDGDRILHAWSADDSALYVGLGVGWDWQIWSVPLDPSEPTQILVADAASIADMSLSPDGEQLAFAAAPALEYPFNRSRLYVQPLGGGAVRTFDIGDGAVDAVAWENATTLIVVTRQWNDDNPWILPATRKLQRVRIEDGTVSDLSSPSDLTPRSEPTGSGP